MHVNRDQHQNGHPAKAAPRAPASAPVRPAAAVPRPTSAGARPGKPRERMRGAASERPAPSERDYAEALKALEHHRVNKALSDVVAEYCRAVEVLRGTPLLEAVDAFLLRQRRIRPISMAAAVELYGALARQEGALHPKQRAFLDRLAAEFPGPLGAVDPMELQEWWDELADATSERVLKEHRNALHALFLWARRQKYWPFNEPLPTECLELKGDYPHGEDDVLLPADFQILLIVGRRIFRQTGYNLLAVLLLGGWAGLRHSEIRALSWEAVSLGDLLIRVSGGATPAHPARSVAITPTLALWLGELGELSGPVIPVDSAQFRQELTRLAHRLQLIWPRNALRNSWISYRCASAAATGGDLAEIAAEAGLSAATLQQHYCGIANAADAHAWFGILPEWCSIYDD